ncbi:hypothetical protein ACOSQ3_031802 [Xanthoceras sorbifolium]
MDSGVTETMTEPILSSKSQVTCNPKNQGIEAVSKVNAKNQGRALKFSNIEKEMMDTNISDKGIIAETKAIAKDYANRNDCTDEILQDSRSHASPVMNTVWDQSAVIASDFVENNLEYSGSTMAVDGLGLGSAVSTGSSGPSSVPKRMSWKRIAREAKNGVAGPDQNGKNKKREAMHEDTVIIEELREVCQNEVRTGSCLKNAGQQTKVVQPSLREPGGT